MGINRHAAKPATGRQTRTYHPPAGSHSESKMSSYIPVFVVVGLFAFFALAMVLKIYHQ